MTVHLTVEHGPHAGVPRTELLRRARVVSRALQLDDTELSIVLTNDETVRRLNAAYRKKDRPTDVLAFAMQEGPGGPERSDLLGDVVVSVETARIQAAREGCDVLDEVTRLMVHGTLHLIGWDHDTRAKDVRMRAETDRLCRLAARRRRTTPARRA